MEQLAAGRTPLTRSSERSPRVPGSERARPARLPGYLLPSCPGRPDRGIPFNVMPRTIGIALGAAGPGELPGLAVPREIVHALDEGFRRRQAGEAVHERRGHEGLRRKRKQRILSS